MKIIPSKITYLFAALLFATTLLNAVESNVNAFEDRHATYGEKVREFNIQNKEDFSAEFTRDGLTYSEKDVYFIVFENNGSKTVEYEILKHCTNANKSGFETLESTSRGPVGPNVTDARCIGVLGVVGKPGSIKLRLYNVDEQGKQVLGEIQDVNIAIYKKTV